MRQLVQNLKTGEIELIEVPTPVVSSSTVLIKSRCSLISVGTERMLVEFGKASLLEKARSQPERVKEVLQKIKTDGLLTTIDAVMARLDEPLPLGYSNVGIVVDIGKNVEGFSIGDRVVSNGSHSEVVNVSKNLVAKIPDNVDDENAVFTVLGSIALEGIRLLSPTLGEYIAVIGLGLIGQLAVQLLIASGCKVLGIDIDEGRVKLAESFGAEGLTIKPGVSPVEGALAFSRGRGVDGVIITASTKSNEPIEYSADMCRKRGRIVLIGVTKIDIPRDKFYKKELSFQVSCSYGPGRYDRLYEEKGIDYPFEYVRWTAKRNFEAVLDMMSMGKIDVKPLITHRFSFNDAVEAYNVLLKEKPLGVILQYEDKDFKAVRLIELNKRPLTLTPSKPCIGLLGVGNFAKMVLLPAIKKTKARLKFIASSGGVSGAYAGRKFGFEFVTSDYNKVLEDEEINTIFIATRHSSHASLVIEALKKGKNVYVEKPLALNVGELKDIISAYKDSDRVLMAGFNRRFSPFVRRLKEVISSRKDPLCINIMVNAGMIPFDNWVYDPEIGGGRIVGEACHFIDLSRFIVGSRIVEVYAITTKGHSGSDEDKMVINLKFEDGSIGTINYFANGSKTYPKERVEVFNEGKILVIDNFKSLIGYGVNCRLKSLRQNKGHEKEVEEFIKAVSDGRESPIPFEELVEVTLASFSAVKSATLGMPIKLVDFYKELLG
jgi:predicted dehydrogenase